MTQAFTAHQVGSSEQTEHRAFMEPTPKRIRVVFGGEVVADSRNVLIMHETKHLPAYYFPMKDIRMDLMEPTSHKTH